MDDAAVVARLVPGDPVLLFEQHEAPPGVAARQRHRRREADDTASDHGDVVRAVELEVMAPMITHRRAAHRPSFLYSCIRQFYISRLSPRNVIVYLYSKSSLRCEAIPTFYDRIFIIARTLGGETMRNRRLARWRSMTILAALLLAALVFSQAGRPSPRPSRRRARPASPSPWWATDSSR